MKLFSAAAVLWLAAAPLALAQGRATIEVGHKANEAYLTGPNGRALYAFSADSRDQSHCYGQCAAAWPPFDVSSAPQAGQGVNQNLLGITRRNSGSVQVTYNGMPLYYFQGDRGPNSTAGEGLRAQGGLWELVSPSGQPIPRRG